MMKKLSILLLLSHAAGTYAMQDAGAGDANSATSAAAPLAGAEEVVVLSAAQIAEFDALDQQASVYEHMDVPARDTFMQRLNALPAVPEVVSLSNEVQSTIDRIKAHEEAARREQEAVHQREERGRKIKEGLDAKRLARERVQEEQAAQEEASRREQEAKETAQREEAARKAQEARETAQREEAVRKEQEARETAQREEAVRKEQEARETAQREEAARKEQEARETAQREETARKAQEALAARRLEEKRARIAIDHAKSVAEAQALDERAHKERAQFDQLSALERKLVNLEKLHEECAANASFKSPVPLNEYQSIADGIGTLSREGVTQPFRDEAKTLNDRLVALMPYGLHILGVQMNRPTASQIGQSNLAATSSARTTVRGQVPHATKGGKSAAGTPTPPGDEKKKGRAWIKPAVALTLVTLAGYGLWTWYANSAKNKTK